MVSKLLRTSSKQAGVRCGKARKLTLFPSHCIPFPFLSLCEVEGKSCLHFTCTAKGKSGLGCLVYRGELGREDAQ